MFEDESYGRVIFRLTGANKKYVMEIIFITFFMFLFLDSAGAVFPSGFNADGDPSEWGASGFLTGDWSVNDTWVPNPGILFIVEDNYNPKQGGSYTGVHIQGNGSNYVFYDEPMKKNYQNDWVWEPYGKEKYDIEAMYLTQDDNYVYFLVVTSQNPDETYDTKKPGDLRIDIDKTLNSTDDHIYELGVKLASTTGLTQSHLYEVSDWHRTTTTNYVPQNYPTIVVSGTDKGAIAGFAYTSCGDCNSGTGSDKSNPIYIIELKISKSELGLSSGSYANPEDFSLVTGCTNESIRITDVFPPSSISNLQNTTYFSRFINWTWTDPSDSDFSHVMVYLNGVFQTNVSAGVQYYFATGLNPETSYEISTRTVDTSGNINQTWVNHTATTAPLPDEVWVDDDWAGSNLGDEVETGKYFGYNAFDVIQDGVDNVSIGGTVHVRAGIYYEMVTVDKSLTLLGAQADVDPRPSQGGRTGSESVIDGFATYQSVIIIDADNVVVNGFEITNATGDMIKQSNSHSDTIVKYNYIHDSASPGDDGVQLKHCINCIIEYNYFENILQDGANIASDSYNGSIRYNEINGSYSENAAIFTYRSTNIDVIGNLVYNVYVNDGIKIGDYRYDDWNYGGVVRDNVVHDGVEDGITIYASNVTVEFNEIYNCYSQNGALHLYNATNTWIKCNKIHDNRANGTLIEDSQNVTLINNDIYNNYNSSFTTAGIWTVGDVREFSANYNNIYNNSDYGFYNGNSSLIVNAENNWWGDASGPYHATSNPSGLGNAVSDYVDFDPWLSSEVVACVVPSITRYWTVGVGGDDWSSSAKFQNTTEINGSAQLKKEVDDYMSFWRLDEGSGTTAYDEAGNFDGALQSDWVSGKYGNALNFDGIKGYVDVEDVGSWENAFTIAAWIKSTATSRGIIFSHSYNEIYARHIQVALEASGQITFLLRGAEPSINAPKFLITSTNSYNDGNWHFVVVTRDGDTAKMYVDGVEVGIETDSAVGTIDPPTSAFIGVAEFDAGKVQYFDGAIDEVRIYNRALSQEEINKIMSDSQYYSQGNVTSGVQDYMSFWRLDEGSGTTAHDEAGNFDGALQNMGDGGWVSGKYGNALNFDGIKGYVDVEDVGSWENAFTIAAWIKSTATSRGIIFSHSYNEIYARHIQVALEASGQITFLLRGAEPSINAPKFLITSTNSYNDGNWHFVVVTRDGDTAKMYVDGVEVGIETDSAVGTIDPPTSAFIGVAEFDAGKVQYFDGAIDEVRIYNRALSQEEINKIMNNSHLDSFMKDAGTGYIWKKIRFNGSVPLDCLVKIYINTTDDGFSWTGWVPLSTNAAPGTTYTIPPAYQKQYGRWKLALETNDNKKTPIIHNVTFISESY